MMAVVPTVRRAAASDVPAIVEVAQAAYSPYVVSIGVRPGPLDADYGAAVNESDVRVAEVDGVVVAFVVLVPHADHLLLENVAVHPDAQGRGIGSSLLRLVEDEATARQLPEVRLYTHRLMAENIARYQRRGYVETHREPQDGFDRVFLTKRLA
jgi:ribosomal protein S18 acetylase RimI-like enzyme